MLNPCAVTYRAIWLKVRMTNLSATVILREVAGSHRMRIVLVIILSCWNVFYSDDVSWIMREASVLKVSESTAFWEFTIVHESV